MISFYIIPIILIIFFNFSQVLPPLVIPMRYLHITMVTIIPPVAQNLGRFYIILKGLGPFLHQLHRPGGQGRGQSLQEIITMSH